MLLTCAATGCYPIALQKALTKSSTNRMEIELNVALLLWIPAHLSPTQHQPRLLSQDEGISGCLCATIKTSKGTQCEGKQKSMPFVALQMPKCVATTKGNKFVPLLCGRCLFLFRQESAGKQELLRLDPAHARNSSTAINSL